MKVSLTNPHPTLSNRLLYQTAGVTEPLQAHNYLPSPPPPRPPYVVCLSCFESLCATVLSLFFAAIMHPHCCTHALI